jgi:NTE family protein
VKGAEPLVNLGGVPYFVRVSEKLKSANSELPILKRGQEIVDRFRKASNDDDDLPVVFASSEPRIGVALGGGSARGLTHIPYIEAMDEMGLRPSVISGTSIGALIGAGWAAGMTGAELREHSFSVLGTMKVIASRLWGAQVRNLGNFFATGFSVQLDAARVVDAFLPDNFPDDFKDLKTPLFVVATDFQSWHQAVFSEGPLRQAIAGSIAIPSLFRPVPFAHHLLVDGGVVNPLPLDQAAANSDILVGIDVNGDPSELLNKTDHKALDVWFGSAQIMMHSLTAHMMAAYPPDVYARPHLHGFGALEFWRVREMVAHVEKDKDNFKRQLSKKIEAFVSREAQDTRAD